MTPLHFIHTEEQKCKHMCALKTISGFLGLQNQDCENHDKLMATGPTDSPINCKWEAEAQLR